MKENPLNVKIKKKMNEEKGGIKFELSMPCPIIIIHGKKYTIKTNDTFPVEKDGKVLWRATLKKKERDDGICEYCVSVPIHLKAEVNEKIDSGEYKEFEFTGNKFLMK